MAAGVPVATRVASVRDRRRGMLVAGGMFGIAAVALSVGAALDARLRPELVAVARACMVGVPIGVGLYAWYTRLNERFGLLLVGAGARKSVAEGKRVKLGGRR